MVRYSRKKLPPPSEDEIDEATEIGHGVDAFSTDNNERILFIKFSCGNGDTATLWFDAHVADYLLRHLEKVLLGGERDPGSGSRTKLVQSHLRESYGTVHQSSGQTRQQGLFSRPDLAAKRTP